MFDSIRHFMWSYQRHFRSSVDLGVKSILEALEPGLEPDTFIIGVRTGNPEKFPPACVEPELHHWAQSSDFYNVLDDVAAIQDAYPESAMIISHPAAREREHQQLFRRALRDAVLHRLDACAARPSGTRIFASIPVQREDFLLIAVIAVDGNVYSRIPGVTSGKVWLHEHRSFDVPCNLVEATIDAVFRRVSDEIV